MQTTPSEKLTISKLKFISKIESGKRVNLYDFTLIDDGIINNLMRRFIYHDSRWCTLDFIDKTISSAFEIARKYSRREDIQDKTLVTRIMEDIASSIQGIDNICKTYSDDRKFVSDVHIIRDSIPAMISDFKISLKNRIEPGDMLTTLLEINKICVNDEISGMIFGDTIESRPSTPILVKSSTMEEDCNQEKIKEHGTPKKKKKR